MAAYFVHIRKPLWYETSTWFHCVIFRESYEIFQALVKDKNWITNTHVPTKPLYQIFIVCCITSNTAYTIYLYTYRCIEIQIYRYIFFFTVVSNEVVPFHGSTAWVFFENCANVISFLKKQNRTNAAEASGCSAVAFSILAVFSQDFWGWRAFHEGSQMLGKQFCKQRTCFGWLLLQLAFCMGWAGRYAWGGNVLF